MADFGLVGFHFYSETLTEREALEFRWYRRDSNKPRPFRYSAETQVLRSNGTAPDGKDDTVEPVALPAKRDARLFEL